MRTKHLALGLLVAVPMMVVGQVADAKVKDQSRNTSEVNVVEAWFDFEDGGSYARGNVGVYETAQGTFIGWLQMERGGACLDGDEPPWWYENFQSFEDGSGNLPTDQFVIEQRNAGAYVLGDIKVGYGGNDCEGVDFGGEATLTVEIDLVSNGVRVRSTETNSAAGPDFSSTSRYTFSGMGANGTMAWWFTPPPGEEPDAETYNVEGRIGTAKSSDSNRSG